MYQNPADYLRKLTGKKSMEKCIGAYETHINPFSITWTRNVATARVCCPPGYNEVGNRVGVGLNRSTSSNVHMVVIPLLRALGNIHGFIVDGNFYWQGWATAQTCRFRFEIHDVGLICMHQVRQRQPCRQKIEVIRRYSWAIKPLARYLNSSNVFDSWGTSKCLSGQIFTLENRLTTSPYLWRCSAYHTHI